MKDHSADGWPEPQPELFPAALLPASAGPPGGPGQLGGQDPPHMGPPGMMPPHNAWVRRGTGGSGGCVGGGWMGVETRDKGVVCWTVFVWAGVAEIGR